MINNINNFNDDIFHGFYKNVHKANCIIIDMLEDDILDLDGNINISNIENVQVDVLWIYIYYLWKNNNSVESSIFYKMTSGGKGGIKASAPLFVSVIEEYLGRKGVMEDLGYNNNSNIKTLLVNFLSNIIEDKDEWGSINIPILKSIYTKVIAKLNNGGVVDGVEGVVGVVGLENVEGREKQINISLIAGFDPESGMINLTEKVE